MDQNEWVSSEFRVVQRNDKTIFGQLSLLKREDLLTVCRSMLAVMKPERHPILLVLPRVLKTPDDELRRFVLFFASDCMTPEGVELRKMYLSGKFGKLQFAPMTTAEFVEMLKIRDKILEHNMSSSINDAKTFVSSILQSWSKPHV